MNGTFESYTRNHAWVWQGWAAILALFTFGVTQGAESDDGQWVMPAKNHAGTRYSGLEEINTNTAGRLKVAWTFSTGVNRGQEAAPIIVSNTMYVITPYPNILYALDLKQPG